MLFEIFMNLVNITFFFHLLKTYFAICFILIFVLSVLAFNISLELILVSVSYYHNVLQV